MSYLLDANVFMSATRLHYGLDFCPAFWDWLIVTHKAAKLFSIEKVADEIAAIEDDLSIWAKSLEAGFFLAPTEQTLPALGKIDGWVRQHTHPDGSRYTPAAMNQFAQSADFYLVAQALERGRTLVTHEVPRNTPTKVQIPNVCLGLGVKCVTPFAMLRSERARFILQEPPGAGSAIIAGL
jgi:Domain of unknown function (DUF4411)